MDEDTYTEDGPLAWVQHPQGLVFAGGEDPGAVPVPAGAVDEVGVHGVHAHDRLPPSHVPQDQHVIAACGTVNNSKSVQPIRRGGLKPANQTRRSGARSEPSVLSFEGNWNLKF